MIVLLCFISALISFAYGMQQKTDNNEKLIKFDKTGSEVVVNISGLDFEKMIF